MCVCVCVCCFCPLCFGACRRCASSVLGRMCTWCAWGPMLPVWLVERRLWSMVVRMLRTAGKLSSFGACCAESIWSIGRSDMRIEREGRMSGGWRVARGDGLKVGGCGGLALLMCGLLELCWCVCVLFLPPFCFGACRRSASSVLGRMCTVHMVCVGADAARVACRTAAVVDGCADAAHSG